MRFGCYGHRINLVVKNALGIPEMSKILAKSRKLVTLFHTSTSVNDKLREKQKLLLSDKLWGHKLIADVPTRWNSTLDMLLRILEQQPALMAVATDESVSMNARTTIQNCILTFEKTSLAEKVVEILVPFKKGTETVCSETNPTINKVIPVVTKLTKGLDEDVNDPTSIKTLKKTMRDQLSNRTEVEDIALLGLILNPFTQHLQHIQEHQMRAKELLFNIAKDVNDPIHVMVKREPGTDLPALPQLPNLPDDTVVIHDAKRKAPEASTDHEEQPVLKKLKSADTEDWLMDVMCVGESQINHEDIVEDEIRRYLNVVIKEDDRVLTFLQWWKKNEIFFPRITIAAKRVLCVQASSVPSERVFSLAGTLVSKKRCRMTPENVDLFIFLNRNMSRFW